jgi:hypothetical protein
MQSYLCISFNHHQLRKLKKVDLTIIMGLKIPFNFFLEVYAICISLFI